MIKVNGTPILTRQFPNRETKYKDFAQDVTTTKCLVELKYESDKDLIDVMFVKKRLDDLGKSSNLFVWYMPYSRMDRQIDGDLFTLKYVSAFIASLGFKKVTVMEPHSKATVDLLRQHGVNAHDIYPTKDWARDVMLEEGFAPCDHIVYPDKGAQARYADMMLQNILTFDKIRDSQTGKIQRISLATGSVNKHSKCIILDDICAKGGTFMGVGDILKTNGASKVILLVAHCEDTIFDGDILKADSPIDGVYTSDSILTKSHPKIKKLNLRSDCYGQEIS